jgi:hypothetical protein
MSICVPQSAIRTLMNFDSDRDTSQLDAVLAGKNLVGDAYPGQVKNYRDQTAQLCNSDVALQPSHGLPDVVTIIVDTPFKPSLQEADVKQAWQELVTLRRCYYDSTIATRCEVRMTDRAGRLFADVNQDTVQSATRGTGELQTAFFHPSYEPDRDSRHRRASTTRS